MREAGSGGDICTMTKTFPACLPIEDETEDMLQLQEMHVVSTKMYSLSAPFSAMFSEPWVQKCFGDVATGTGLHNSAF